MKSKFARPRLVTCSAIRHSLRHLLCFAALAVLPLAAPAFADSATVTKSANLPMQEIAKYIRRSIVVLEYPTLTFNWFSAQNRSSVWNTAFQSNVPVGLEHYKGMAQNFYQAYCSTDTSINPADCRDERAYPLYGWGGFYGPGLYLALDPIATRVFGGGADDWVLAQVRLPRGLRILSLTGALQDPKTLSNAAKAEFAAFGCDFVASTSPTFLEQVVNAQMQGRATPSGMQCALNLRKLLKDVLKVQALYYMYNAVDFAQCPDKTPKTRSSTFAAGRQGAFILADPSVLQAEDVRVFNRQSNDAMDVRGMIERLFEANQEQVYRFGSSTKPLWDDVTDLTANKRPQPELAAWMRKNLFGCQDLPSIGAVPNLRYSDRLALPIQ